LYGHKSARTGRRRGAVLASALLLGFAAVGATALAFAVGVAFWESAEGPFISISLENTAQETLALSARWFEGELAASEPSELRRTFERQMRTVPDGVLSPLREVHPNAAISAFVMDQAYDSNFESEALPLDLPRGRISTITFRGAVESEDIVYTALRFELRVTVSERVPLARKAVLRKGIVALYDESGHFFRTVTSYMKKR